MISPQSLKGSALILAIAIGGTTAQAQVANSSFESDAKYSLAITGWNELGHAFISDTELFSTPTQGSFQATLATGLDGQFGEPTGSGVSGASAEAFLGLGAGSLAAVGNGNVDEVSAITQTIALNVGDELRFDFNFLTTQVYNDHTAANEGVAQRPNASANDFGFLSLSRSGTSQVIKLSDLFYGYQQLDAGDPDGFNTGLMPTPSTDPFFSESGYLPYTYTATAAGTYTIGFGVADAFTTATNPFGNSGLQIDNVRVVPAVPEPATLAALGLGVAAFARRRKKA